MLIRYSRWDGSQAVPDLDADDLLSAMADDLMLDGDPWRALRRLFQQGLQHPEGQRTPGLQDLLKQLRQRRQQRLDRYDLGSALEDIKKKLADVIQKEREGIKDRLAGQSAEQKLAELDTLPPDPAGQIRELQSYDFVDPEAKRLFDELMQALRQQMLQPFLKGMQQALQGMTPEDLRRLREMLQDLNRMLRQRAEGEEPDFQAFKGKWGQFFPGAESLDDLLAQLGRQMAQMQSLLESMSPGQRRELQELMSSLFMQDERLEAALTQLAGHLDTIDRAQVEKLLGEEAARDLEKLREIAKKLEEAGYLERKGDRLELTARAVRRIADKALRDIFAHLKRDRFGRHVVSHRGAGGDRADDTKHYEFGDPFLLDLKQTLMNAVERGGPGTPVRLVPDDFEVFRTELSTRAATVVMLDMSRSMINNGLFVPAKKVALALHALIRGQFPRDSLHVVGFSLYAREFTAEQLPSLTWTDWNVGTNMHAGFALSRQLLGSQKVSNRQIIMITDGEPTAHLEGTEAEFSYPPTRRTLQETLKEVQRCTREGITINTFMLARSPSLTAFVQEMARINRGRAFFAAPERLGEYVLVDYVRNKRRRSSGN